MKNPRRKRSLHPRLLKHLRKVVFRPRTGGRDDGNTNEGLDEGDEGGVEAEGCTVEVDAVEHEFAGAEELGAEGEVEEGEGAGSATAGCVGAVVPCFVGVGGVGEAVDDFVGGVGLGGSGEVGGGECWRGVGGG